jgi:hypothetical protein
MVPLRIRPDRVNVRLRAIQFGNAEKQRGIGCDDAVCYYYILILTGLRQFPLFQAEMPIVCC